MTTRMNDSRRWDTRRVLLGVLALGLSACSTPPEPTAPPEPEAPPAQTIDQRSYDLGVIGAFSEVVSYGIKQLALSAAMPPERMATLIDEAQGIAERHGVSTYLEDDFLVTDLFPAEVTDGQQVLLIYTGATKDEYDALKARKATLVAEDRYEGEARTEIARGMGRLLSYPDPTIERMLSEVTP